ncbi:MAG: hypothetical protein U9R74_08985, partial [Pseudomonadota bacterium]|nr:hypothetical protein [Pseudomonadota bacterium]
MKNLTKLYFVIAVLSLTACSYEDMADRFVPNEESRFSRDYLQRLQEKDLEYVRAYLVPEVADQVTDEKLLNVAGYFPSGERLSTDLIGSHVTLTDSQWRGNFSFEYRFTGGWALANVVVKKTDGVLAVLGFNVYRTQASRQEINRFTLGGRSALQYTVLTLSIAAPLFVLVTAYFCLRAPIPKRKWLWVLFVLVGVGSVSVNWTTGQLAVQPLSIKLLSASAFSPEPEQHGPERDGYRHDPGGERACRKGRG